MKIEWTIKIDGAERSSHVTVNEPGPEIIEEAAKLVMLIVGEHLSIALLGVEADAIGFPLYASRLHTSLVSRADHDQVVAVLKAHRAGVASA